ncbi:MAG: type II toxin-antitoxin system HicB family antitoxin [Rhodobacteraceae bacterium]|nr:type II toxin-antitoxin system HicB family antitoxin [Paracoccaceae bacterium]
MNNYSVCYYWDNGTEWEGLCTTYDIAMFGTTLEETEQYLEEAIETYLEEVYKLPEQDKNRLLKRRSPWYLRLTLNVGYLINQLGKKVGNRDFSFPQSFRTQYIGIASKKSIIST